MASNQDVQEVLNTLTSSLAVADGKAFAESFSAAIAKHNAETEAAIAAVTATVAAASSSANEAAHSHEQLQRIAEQHQQEVEQRENREQDKTEKSQDDSAISQDNHQQVLQHIATSAAENGSTLAMVPITSVPAPPPTKPLPGSEEWNKLRRDNHKEVERRRRETINEGINDLSKVVPNCDKNKGSILRQAVKYIQSIHAENERLMADSERLAATKIDLDKYLLEKSVAEATLQNLNVQHDQLKREYEELRQKMGDSESSTNKKQRVE
ncbi:basic helix-loop-helix protein [Entomortierella beljakovae]|nr:basic helix-loop-helix protein [Entomortierella beljakovae]